MSIYVPDVLQVCVAVWVYIIRIHAQPSLIGAIYYIGFACLSGRIASHPATRSLLRAALYVLIHYVHQDGKPSHIIKVVFAILVQSLSIQCALKMLHILASWHANDMGGCLPGQCHSIC